MWVSVKRDALRARIPLIAPPSVMYSDPDRHLLVVTQVYPPDPAAVGQYIGELVSILADDGWRITVLTARNGYDDPTTCFPAYERHGNVLVRRFKWSSFGKRSLRFRIGAHISFITQAFGHGICIARPSLILVSTSPPLAHACGVALGFLRKVPFCWWVMDINPDQLCATGRLPQRSCIVKALEWLNRVALRRALAVITLDEHMAHTLKRKCPAAPEPIVVPLWPLASHCRAARKACSREVIVNPEHASANAFRRLHGLGKRFIVMYAGNHTAQHPLDTLLGAAVALRDRTDVQFVFVGGGALKAGVEALIRSGCGNIVSLPYQPQAMAGDMLRAASMHVVTVGGNTVGIVHPSKIYNILGVGRPALVIGPRLSPATRLIEDLQCGWQVEHGDVGGAVEAITAAACMSQQARDDMGARAARGIEERFPGCGMARKLQDLLSMRSVLRSG